MPTYNYYCKNCETHFSYFQKMSESSISKCKECGIEMNRIITGGSGVIFKGSGFYLTDYKNKKKNDSDTMSSKDDTKKVEKKNKSITDNKNQVKSKKDGNNE